MALCTRCHSPAGAHCIDGLRFCPSCIRGQLKAYKTEHSRVQEAMFCFERAIKLFYWSCVVFPYTEGEGMDIAIGDEILSLLNGSADNDGPAYDSAMVRTVPVHLCPSRFGAPKELCL